MRRRLMLLSSLSSGLVLMILGIAVVQLLPAKVADGADRRLRAQILSVAAAILETNDPSDADISHVLAQVDTVDGSTIGVKTPRDTYLGRGAADVRLRWPPGRQHTVQPRSILPLLYPRFFDTSSGGQIASQGLSTGSAGWIIEGTISRHLLAGKEIRRWIVIGGLAALAVAASLVSSFLLARRITRPLDEAVRAALLMGEGNLRAVTPTRGSPEIMAISRALNHLAGRIERLVESERERAADVSHRLRTPLTVLALEAERLKPQLGEHPGQLVRLNQAIHDLESGLDDVITEFQQVRPDGVARSTDATAVLADHLAYWVPFAELQHRTVLASTAGSPAIVALSAKELGAAIDGLISNIFRHTAPGTSFQVGLSIGADTVAIVVADAGVNDAPDIFGNTGSTGVGLKSIRSSLEAVGGRMSMVQAGRLGTSVRLELPLVDLPEASPKPF